MDGFLLIVTIVLILAYIGFAIWFICKRQTTAGSIAASAGFICGGLAIIPVASAIASFVCWAIVVIIVIAIIGALLGG